MRPGLQLPDSGPGTRDRGPDKATYAMCGDRYQTSAGSDGHAPNGVLFAGFCELRETSPGSRVPGPATLET